MTTPRQAAPRSKSRNVASQPAAQQSSALTMADHERQADETDRQRNPLDNQGSQGRHVQLSLREEEDDETATRH